MFAAVAAFLKAFSPLLLKIATLLASGIQFIIDFFVFKTKRLRESYELEQAAKKKAADEQKRKEDANIEAYDLLVEDAYKSRYNVLRARIKNKEYANVLSLIKLDDMEAVDDFLYDTDLSSDYRALKIVNYMRKKDDNGNRQGIAN